MPLACASVLLAAGGSTRMGYPKQLLQLEGESLLRRAARFAVDAGCSPNFVILGSDFDRLRPELDDLDVTIVENTAWSEGMGTSIRCGMQEILRLPQVPPKVVFLVCDQLRLNAQLLRRLIELPACDLRASRYREGFGVPAVFSSRFFSELAGLSGEQGARKILAAHLSEARFIDFPGGELDVDTPEDAALL